MRVTVTWLRHPRLPVSRQIVMGILRTVPADELLILFFLALPFGVKHRGTAWTPLSLFQILLRYFTAAGPAIASAKNCRRPANSLRAGWAP